MAAAPFVDARQVRRAFAKAAPAYGQHDFLVREVDRRMQERLDYVRLEPKQIIDLGCSRGASLAPLMARYPGALALGLDAVPEMLVGEGKAPAWRRWLPFGRSEGPLLAAADALAIPCRQGSVDLVWSNLLLHWLDNPLPALVEAHRALAVGGLLMFSTFGPDTLKELRSAFGDGYARTQRFTDMHDLGDMLVEAGYADPVMDMEVLTLTYDDFPSMVADLRAAGSHCAMTARPRGLTGRGLWQQARQAYEGQRREGKLPATFEVVYGHAWKVPPKKIADGRSVIRFDLPRGA